MKKKKTSLLLPLVPGVILCFALLLPKASAAYGPGWDNIPPTAVCDDQVNVSLTGNGQAIVYAGTFDEGSNDNLCLASVKVRRKDEPYAPFASYVVFDCDDIGQLVKVELKAIDCSGNYNICWSYAMVEDKLPPQISCPHPVTVSCDETEDWNAVGMASATDNCGVASLDFTETDNTGSCGTGTRTRVWTATDFYGNSSSCTQTIHVVDNTPVHVEFPPDYTTYDCTSEDALHPDSLPAPFDRPKVLDADCELIATNYKDWVFTAAEPACIKVLREWKVIDWCSYEYGQEDEGYWEDRQILKIIDTLPPTFTCPDDVVVSTDYGACTATFSLPQPTDIEDCLSGVEVTVETELGDSTAFTDVPLGEYNAKYILEDGCNNVSTCEIKVSVVDSSPPTAACLNGVSLSLMENGMAEIWASDIEISSYDFCTPYEQLKFRIGFEPDPGQTTPPPSDSLIFTCDNLGTNIIALWVGDNAGNWDYCTTYAIVSDNHDVCEGTTGGVEVADMAGRIFDEQGDGIPQTQIMVDSSSYWQMTNDTGSYWFSAMPMYDSYVLRPEREGNQMEGITMDDLMALAKHLADVDTLDTPYQMIAADVDGSGFLDQQDLLTLHFMLLGLENAFPDSLNWRFVPAGFEFPIENPLAVNFPQSITVNDLLQSVDSLNFVGIKLGDIDCTAMGSATAGATANSSAAEDRSRSSEPLLIDDQRVQAGSVVKVPVYQRAGSRLLGMRLEWQHAGLELERLEEVRARLIGMKEQQPEQLGLSWVSGEPLQGENPLFHLYFRAQHSGYLSEMLSLDASSLLALEQSDGAAKAPAALQFRPLESAESVQAFPNPFHNQFLLRFSLPRPQPVLLQVWSANGQLVYQREHDALSGSNEWEVPGKQLGRPGTYLFRISAEDLQHNGRIVRIPN